MWRYSSLCKDFTISETVFQSIYIKIYLNWYMFLYTILLSPIIRKLSEKFVYQNDFLQTSHKFLKLKVYYGNADTSLT